MWLLEALKSPVMRPEVCSLEIQSAGAASTR